MVWIWYALLSAFSAAFVTIFAKMGVKDVDPILTATIRSIVTAIFLLIVSASLKKTFQNPLQIFSYQNFLFITLSGIAGGLSWIFYLIALKYGPTAPVATLDRLSLILTVILTALMLGESIYLKHFIGAILVILGADVVAM